MSSHLGAEVIMLWQQYKMGLPFMLLPSRKKDATARVHRSLH